MPTPSTIERPWSCDGGRVVIAPEGSALAVDSVSSSSMDVDGRVFHRDFAELESFTRKRSPSAVPVMNSEWMTVIDPSRSEMAEASLISSFFEGVPHAVGERRREEYLRVRAQNKAGGKAK